MRGRNLVPEATIAIDGHRIAAGTKEVDQRLEEILKISYQDFMRTFYARQKDLDNLLKEGGTGKREYLLKLLGLDEIRERSSERIKSHLRLLEDQKNRLSGALSELGDVELRIEEVSRSITSARMALEDARKREAALCAQMERKRLELDLQTELRRSHDLVAERIAGIQSKAQESKHSILAEQARLREIEASKRLLLELEPKQRRLKVVLARLEQLEPLRKEYDRLQGMLIKTRTELDLARRAMIEQEQRHEALLKDKCNLEKILPQEEDYQQNQARFNDLEALRDQHTQLQNMLGSERVRLDTISANISRVQGSLREILHARNRLAEILPGKERCEALQKELAGAELQRTRQKDLDNLSARRSGLEARLKGLRDQAAGAEEELCSLGDLEKREGELRAQDLELDRLGTDLRNGLADLQRDLGIEESRVSETSRNLARLMSMGKESVCPACERRLGDQHVLLTQKYEHAASAAEAIIAALKERMRVQREKIEGVISSRSRLRTSFDGLNAQKSRRAELNASLKGIGAQRIVVEAEIKEVLLAIQSLGMVSFDPVRFEALGREIQQLHPFVEEQRVLVFKLEEQPRRERELDSLQDDSRTTTQKIERLNLQMQSLGYAETEYLACRSRLNELKGVHDNFILLSQRIAEIPRLDERMLRQKEELQELQAAALTTEKAVHDLGFDPVEQEMLLRERRALSKAEETFRQISSKIAHEAEIRERLGQAEKSVAELEADLLKTGEQLATLGYSGERHEAARLALASADADLSAARKEASGREVQLGVLQGDLQRLERDALRKKECEAELSGVSRRLQVVEVTRALVNRFMDHILVRIRDDIAASAGEILDEVSGKYSILKIDDDFNILVEDGGEFYPISRYSGGEIDMIAVSVRVAISEYLMRFGPEGGSYSFLIMDEVFGSQDLEHREKMIHMLRSLEARFPQIIAISHISDVQGQFDNALLVIEDDLGNARVEAS